MNFLATRLAAVVAVIGLSACGGPAGVYRGTTTQTITSGGTATTKTLSGDIVTIFNSAEANQLVFESTGLAYTATRSGDTLTFQSGQTSSVMETNGNSSTSLTSGTGTLSASALSINLTLTISQTGGGNTTNATATLAFTGQKL